MVTHENILALLVKKDMTIAALEHEVARLRADADNQAKLIAELQKASTETSQPGSQSP